LSKILRLVEHSAIGRYALAAVIAVAAVLLRLALAPLLDSGAPFITLFPAVALIAMLTGFWAAILAGILGTLWIEYTVIPPFGIELDVPTAVRVAIMVLSSGLIGMLGQKMRQSREQALEKAHQLDAKTKEFEAIIAVVSHDLRAPLVNVRGFSKEVEKDCQMIRKILSDVTVPQEIKKRLSDTLEQSIPESLKFIETSAEMMDNLAKSLVAVARAGMTPIEPEKLEMNDILARIVANLEFKFKEAAAKITIEPLPPCTADRQQVTQIITNLLDNAVKYLDRTRPGQICVRSKVENDRAVYCIEDNGVGIAPEHQEKIFELFYRLGDKGVGGEGIGLTMVKRMAEHNQGRIWVQSQKGKGSKFFLALPR
jgi:signal transduction histidine kinase